MLRIKRSTFALFFLMMVVLAVASLLDNLTGIQGSSESVYHSVPFAAMWGMLVVLALIYICRRKLQLLCLCLPHRANDLFWRKLLPFRLALILLIFQLLWTYFFSSNLPA